jgi:hypothetical protein
MSDHRTDSERFREFAKEAGIDENDPSLVRLLKALEATEKWQAGTMTEYLEIAFIEFELEAAFKRNSVKHTRINGYRDFRVSVFALLVLTTCHRQISALSRSRMKFEDGRHLHC